MSTTLHNSIPLVDTAAALRAMQAAKPNAHKGKKSGIVKTASVNVIEKTNAATKKASNTAPMFPAWVTSTHKLVGEYCDHATKLSDLVEQLKLTIEGQSRDDVRTALLSAVSIKYQVKLVPTKSLKKTEAGKMVFDSEAKNYETAKKQLQRLILAVMPAEDSEATSDDTSEGEVLSRKESLTDAPEVQSFMEKLDELILSSGISKKQFMAAFKEVAAQYE